MIFNELNFWVFYLCVFGLYWILPHKAQNRLLLVASYIFYGAWDWRFLSLIAISTIVDYYVGLQLDKQKDAGGRKKLLILSLLVNLGLLGIFKYFGFFAENFQALLGAIGIEASPLTLSIVLPVGISFYTFQTMSYTIDVYQKRLKPTRDFFDFALFVAFFPQLVAGPIERARNLLPNITNERDFAWPRLRRGAVLCLQGLIKKIVIADGISSSVEMIYASPDPTRLDVIFATWLFAIQIYCDFSGYTDIARGVSKMLGIELMANFKQPYFANGPREFWRRWHISLSTWLRDYLYIPLGGNRNGIVKTYRNLLFTMILGGLWHGAAWNFIAWGLFHGSLLIAGQESNRRFKNTFKLANQLFIRKLTQLFGIIVFFQITCYGWLLFRANSYKHITDLTERIIDGPAGVTMSTPPLASLIGIGYLFVWDLFSHLQKSDIFYEKWPMIIRATLYAFMVYLLAFGATTSPSTFIYFQF